MFALQKFDSLTNRLRSYHSRDSVIRSGRQTVARLISVSMIVATILVLFGPSTAFSQNRTRSKTLPGRAYYNGFSDYYRGDFDRALRTFRNGARGAYQDAYGRFLDSICYYTMMGECFYQVGNYSDAVVQYEAAIALYAKFKAWPARTTFPPQVLPNNNAFTKARISWGTPTRTTTIGNFPSRMNVMIGDLNAVERALTQGGVVNPAELRGVDIVEVMRCTALAIHRRHIIKGPTCKHDPFTKDMLTQLSARSAAGTMSGAWQGVLYGLAQSSAGQYERAIVTLQQSLQTKGFDHPLTPLALLEMGYLARVKGDAATAQKLLLEASFSGAVFYQYDIVGDALHAATVNQMIQDRSTVFAPLAPAAAWAKRDRANHLYASLVGDAIWSLAESGAPLESLKLISRNSRALRGGDLANSRVGTQWLYCSALANSREGNTKNANRDLGRFLTAARSSSLWLYQIALADDLVVKNRVTERGADLLYSEMLRDPTPADWVTQPMETIAYLITPHIGPMLRWHSINVSLKAEIKALEISDLVRRHRFYSALPLGGRQLALRWVTSAPSEALNAAAKQQQTDFLTRYPQLKQLGDRSNALVAQLRQAAVSPKKSSEEIRVQKKLLGELASVEAGRELVLQSIALRREPCEMVFPPQYSVQQIQDGLLDKQLVIAVFYDGSKYYINLISKNSYSLESVLQASTVDKQLGTLLKELGLGGAGGTTTVDQIKSTAWRDAARQLSAILFPRTRPNLLESFAEVIVVPDGRLWYFPFELIQIGTDEESVNLFEKVNVRYAPTLSTTITDGRQRRRFTKTLVVTGRTHSRDDQQLVTDAFANLQTQNSDAETIDKSNKTPSNLIASFVDQILVWDELDSAKAPGLLLAPMAYDAGRPGSAIGAWLSLPWVNVDQLILPGYKSGIGGSNLSSSGGEELFLMSCSMLANGTKSMLLSRWPVGGQTTLDLTTEFAKESLHSSPVEALRRSIELLKETEIDLQTEPRVREGKIDEPIKAQHPLFWASYMLFDLAAPAPIDPPAEDPDAENENDGEGGENAGDDEKDDDSDGN